MKSTIPAEVLTIKTRLDQWRATRHHIRERMPADLRQSVAEICRRHPRAVIRRVLKIDPWRLCGSMTTKVVPIGNKQETPFFEFPTDSVLPIAATAPNFRLQIERPDGSRLTLTSPALDLVSARQICADFLRDNQQ